MAKSAGAGVLNPAEIATFCTQIAMILKSGIPLPEGVGILCEDLGDKGGREILETVHRQVEAGNPLYQALEATGCFPGHVVDMTEIGEKTGRLDEVMDSLCAYYEREEAVRAGVRSAVTYPLVMIALMLLVIGVLVIQVLPIFAEVFRDLGTEMTGFSRGVMQLGQSLAGSSAVLAVVLALLVAAVLVLRATGHWASLKRRLPLARGLYEKMAAGRFAAAMALMVSSGLDSDQSLEMVHKLAGEDGTLRQKIEDAQSRMAAGSGFADALVEAGLFTGIHARMVTVGYKTGTADLVLRKVAQRCEEEVDTRLSALVAVLEPTLVAILSIIVGMILLSVMLPLMGIMSSIG